MFSAGEGDADMLIGSLTWLMPISCSTERTTCVISAISSDVISNCILFPVLRTCFVERLSSLRGGIISCGVLGALGPSVVSGVVTAVDDEVTVVGDAASSSLTGETGAAAPAGATGETGAAGGSSSS